MSGIDPFPQPEERIQAGSDALSSSPMARDYSRAYWRHLVKSGEILAMMGLTEINLAYYQDLMRGIRAAIAGGRFAEFRDGTLAAWQKGDLDPL